MVYKLATMLLFCALSLPSFASVEISGIWKHSEKQAWISIAFDNKVGIAKIARHEQNPKAAGLEIIIDIIKNTGKKGWVGKMYSAEVDDFIPVNMQLISHSVLLVKEPAGTDKVILKLHKEPKVGA